MKHKFKPPAVGVYGQARETGVMGKGVSGVVGEGDGDGGLGVLGRGSQYGGYFAGGQAQIVLEPSLQAGPPTSGVHLPGELFFDINRNLFLCVDNADPAGTWKKVSLVDP